MKCVQIAQNSENFKGPMELKCELEDTIKRYNKEHFVWEGEKWMSEIGIGSGELLILQVKNRNVFTVQ